MTSLPSLYLLLLPLLSMSEDQLRVKRDFMFVSSVNETDPLCFQRCNTAWRESFEYSLNVSVADFYEFPLHPILLDHSTFLAYCALAAQKTRCYIDQCGDLSADTVFSPSNFICDFKRQQFIEVRPCLAESEPLTFLKCDQSCHEQTIAKREEATKEDDLNLVYSAQQLSAYEDELASLCSFQRCYMQCMAPIVQDLCSPSLAARAIDLISSFVHWHAVDIYEWHVSSDRLSLLAPSCAALANKSKVPNNDEKVIQLIARA